MLLAHAVEPPPAFALLGAGRLAPPASRRWSSGAWPRTPPTGPAAPASWRSASRPPWSRPRNRRPPKTRPTGPNPRAETPPTRRLTARRRRPRHRRPAAAAAGRLAGRLRPAGLDPPAGGVDAGDDRRRTSCAGSSRTWAAKSSRACRAASASASAARAASTRRRSAARSPGSASAGAADRHGTAPATARRHPRQPAPHHGGAASAQRVALSPIRPGAGFARRFSATFAAISWARAASSARRRPADSPLTSGTTPSPPG